MLDKPFHLTYHLVPHVLFIKNGENYKAKWLYCQCGNKLDGEYDVVKLWPGGNPEYDLYFSCDNCGFYVRGKEAKILRMAFGQGII